MKNILTIGGLIGLGLTQVACSSAADKARESDYVTRTKEAQSQDMALAQPLDLHRVAVLHAGYQDNKPNCDGYCLRLLYGGEAKTVVAANASKELTTLGDFADVPMVAYHIEKRATCPAPDLGNDREFSAATAAHRPPSQINDPVHSAMDVVRERIANGECLIGEPSNLNDVTTVLLFTFQYDSDIPHNRSVGTFSLLRVEAFAANGSAFIPVFRRTKVNWQIIPESLAEFSFISDLYHRGGAEPRVLSEIVQQDLHIAGKMAESTSLASLRQSLTTALDDRSLGKDATQWMLIKDYLQALIQDKEVDQSDVLLLGRLLDDPRVRDRTEMIDIDMMYMKNVDFSPLAAPLLRAILAADISGAKDGGDVQSRLFSWSSGLGRVPEPAIAANRDLMLKLAADPARARLGWEGLYHLSALPSADVLPLLRTYSTSPEARLREVAMRNYCQYGTAALPDLAVIEAYARQRPDFHRRMELPEAERAWDVSSARYAWAALGRLGMAEKVADEVHADYEVRADIKRQQWRLKTQPNYSGC